MHRLCSISEALWTPSIWAELGSVRFFLDWFRKKSAQVKKEDGLRPYPLGSELNPPSALRSTSVFLGFSEALCPEGNPTGAPGPSVDGREWSPGPDGSEPWILPSTARGREQFQPGGSHQDRWEACAHSPEPCSSGGEGGVGCFWQETHPCSSRRQ